VDRNTLLAFVLSMGVLTLWFIWKAETMPPPTAGRAGGPTMEADTGGADGGPAATAEDGAELKPEWAAAESAVVPGRRLPAPVEVDEVIELWERSFETQRYRATLTNRGGGLKSWELKEYFEKGKRGEEENRPIELIQLGSGERVALMTAFTELGLGDFSAAMYRVEAENEGSVSFVLERGGVSIRKQYTLDEEYGFHLRIEVVNETDRIVEPRFEIQWPAAVGMASNDFRELSLVAYDSEEGVTREAVASVGSPSFFGRMFGGSDQGPTRVPRGVSWAGVDIRYFLSVLIAKEERDLGVTFMPVEPGKVAVAVLAFEPVGVAPGERAEREFRGFVGPKRSDLLAAAGSELTKSVSLGYSWLEPLTLFFHWLLRILYRVVPNYGVGIIVITILVRVVTAPIMARQMKSMEKMRALQPQLKEVQAEHADDRARQSEAMMALYKEHGVNPLGGCLPMLLQFPVFIGLFYALQSSFALRNAPFVWWIDDLSAPESLFEIPGMGFPVRLLPLVMGGSMVLQQRMTPMTMDPAQARMMLIMMPVMMTVLFYQFPSGLVLYWMVSNFLGIAHQLWVRRGMAAA
jgi:YidC/Oxa1 family membrane protein insertase